MWSLFLFCSSRFENSGYFLLSFTKSGKPRRHQKNCNKNLHCKCSFHTLKEFVILPTRHISLSRSEQAWLRARYYLIPHLVSSSGWSKEEKAPCGRASRNLAFHKLFPCLIPFVINIFAVTVHFLVSLLFPINCFYLSLWFPPFGPPTLNSILSKQEGQEGGGNTWRDSGLGESRWRHWIGEYHSWTMMVLKQSDTN